MIKKILLLLLISKSVQASMQSSYDEGKNMGSSLAQKPSLHLNHGSVEQVPRFKGIEPDEAKLYESKLLNDFIERKLRSEDDDVQVGKTLIETAQNRERFTLDTETDPLFQVFHHKTVEEELQITPTEPRTKEPKYMTKTCDEGGENVTYECFENRQVIPKVPIKKTTLFVNHVPFSEKTESYNYVVRPGNWRRHTRWGTATRRVGWLSTLPKEIGAFRKSFCPNFVANDSKTGITYKIDCSRIQDYEIHNASSMVESNGIYTILTSEQALQLTLQHDTYEGEEIDEWLSNCQVPEQMVEEGLCQYGSRELTQGPETRQLNGHPIFKDEWQYKQIYHCKMIKDECSALKALGCFQNDSKCLEKRKNKCWIYQQSYQCPSGTLHDDPKKESGLSTFCLTGHCHPITYEANHQMLEVISRLQVLKEIQDDIRTQQNGNFEIFKGKSYQCSRNCVNFKDCCGGSKGWGVSLKLAGCREEEKQLAKMREADLCHLVGTYCSKKILKKCVSKKSVFCCFGTKLARLIHEQGRPQLGLGWGEAKQPCCRGVKVAELSQMDLSKMDLRELFSDVMKPYREPNITALQEKTSEKVNRNLEEISRGMKVKGTQPGVVDAKNGL